MAGNSVSRRKATKKDVCTSSPEKSEQVVVFDTTNSKSFCQRGKQQKSYVLLVQKKSEQVVVFDTKIAYPSYTTMVTLLLLSHIVFASAICRHRKGIIRKLYLYIFSVLRSKEQLAFIFVLVTCLLLILRQILSTSNGIFRCCTWWQTLQFQ